MRTWLALAFAFAACVGWIPTASAQEPQQAAEEPQDPAVGEARASADAEPVQVAQAEESEPQEPAEQKPAGQKPAAAKPPPSGIEEIVVLGSESEAVSDSEAADSVTGFGAEDLAALGAQDIADLAGFTPNLEIVTGGATTPTFFIRGVGLNDFNANSTGAVAIYQDDVAINAPALQLGTLYDVEQVNVLRGPQGTGLARNASAGAIKLYSRKPTGQFGGFLRSDLGDYQFRDFEGAIEAPIFEDMLSGRFAFRFTERDGTMKNRCGNAPPLSERALRPPGGSPNSPPWSLCGEAVDVTNQPSQLPEGLPDRVNDIGNWAARGTLLFEPTLDTSFLINAHGSKRDEWSRLGQSIGVNGFTCLDDFDPRCYMGPLLQREYPVGPKINLVLGGPQGTGGYWNPDVVSMLIKDNPCFAPGGGCTAANAIPASLRPEYNKTKIKIAKQLAEGLDEKPWAGDFNMCTDQDPTTPGTQCQKKFGRTINDTWGSYLRGDLALPGGIELVSVTGYDTYNRLIDIDLDFSPETLFQIRTMDDGWQVNQNLSIAGQLDEVPLSWEVGGWVLREQLNVNVLNDLGRATNFAAGQRDYTQDLWSAAGYVSMAYDFWRNFTLDGGFRWNWENKKLDYVLTNFNTGDYPVKLDNVWSAPTGTVRLTYRFREDTHVFWKYTRGWKPGTYNATSALLSDFETNDTFPNISVAEPETIDAFETGVRGSWIEGRLGLDFSVFYYNYQNYQLFTAQQFSGGQPEFVILNAKHAQVYGAEVDAVARPWLGAFFNVRFGWLESQFLDFVQVQQEIVGRPTEGGGTVQSTVTRELQNTGNRLLNSPEFKVSLTAEQTLPLGRWGAITARYDGVWTDTTFYDATEGRGIPNVQNVEFLPENTIAQGPYWLHNLRLSYRLPGGQIEIAGWVRNLTNQVYKTFAFDGSTFNRTTIYLVGDPRTIGGSLVINF